jgi:hypothetical protein
MSSFINVAILPAFGIKHSNTEGTGINSPEAVVGIDQSIWERSYSGFRLAIVEFSKEGM